MADEEAPKTDQQKADDYRARMTVALEPVIAIMAEAVAEEFNISTDISGNPPKLNSINISKTQKL